MTERASSELPPGGGPAWRGRLHEVIFEADTPAGRAFDVGLLLVILASVAAVLLESVPDVRDAHGRLLWTAEWIITGLFTVEYVLRLLAVRRPWRYATSFFGVVDLLAILPTYLALVIPHTQAFMVIRAVRLLRVFRILKLARFLSEAEQLARALSASRRKIIVFLGGLLTIVLIMGAAMYVIEGEENGFTSIPRSMYWAVVTVTTVGYGDIVPRTSLGRLLSAIAMILGYSIIAVPTGIVSAELARATLPVSTQACPACGLQGHDVDARHCKHCGAPL
jgi:voltage-gated potassium channel